MRLDKFIANFTLYSRKEVKKLIKAKRITVNDSIASRPEMQIDEETDTISLDGQWIGYEPYIYYLLNKPQNCLSTTRPGPTAIVTDFLPANEVEIYQPFPVGRLDKDTEGLLLLTNDGDFAHDLLSPKKLVSKEYYAEIEGIVTEEDVEAFAKGLTIDQGDHCAPSQLDILATDPAKNRSEITVTLTEGKYHQVKRMFQAVGKEVIYLQRFRIGSLYLPEELELGTAFKLLPEEAQLALQNETD
ncbi:MULTISPECIES: pseudouridine synthase [Aerococcus]|uniref:pseudouridine synthase n=1 Tax=Aerococcus TaxID=1375 RepID=UPI0018A722E5|nr:MULTISPECIES: pseudouridine synthase [Aerococcus]MCY3035298.1 rRNA pseudouridine synthase [Aerococcus sp. Group 2]MCY3038721.1 rRNA pseudouridine synthase [Aerococcus sp. Group 2]MCY3040876.1 rRNA pseudouridine synthase [Aerococcus sp. Group 2]MCY3042113.1 rRNA pseudouridine synthase [Aerococcus sp. Group 2]MDK6520565.1 pseudouridine synthase [Aerococcus urinae]